MSKFIIHGNGGVSSIIKIISRYLSPRALVGRGKCRGRSSYGEKAARCFEGAKASGREGAATGKFPELSGEAANVGEGAAMVRAACALREKISPPA